MRGYVVAAGAALFLLLLIVELLRRRQLKEKYAALWLIVGMAIAIGALIPTIPQQLARITGIELPSNLLFFSAIFLLLAVTVHQSWELSRLEDETRSLAEEIALLRAEVDERLASRGTEVTLRQPPRRPTETPSQEVRQTTEFHPQEPG